MTDPQIQAATLTCQRCQSGQFEVILEAADFDSGDESFALSRCVACGLVRTDPYLDDDQLGPYYQQTYYGETRNKFVGPLERLTRMANRRRAQSIMSCLGPPGERPWRILDVGCGRGALLSALAEEGCECHGVEREDFPEDEGAPGVTLHRRALTDIEFPQGHFDAVILWHTLEHFTAPGKVLAEVARISRRGAQMFAAVPNWGSAQARLFKAEWFHLDLPRHLHHFDPDSLSGMLADVGFEVRSRSTLSLEQNLFGFVQSALNRVPGGHPNTLYSMLRAGASGRPPLAFLIQALAAGLLLPLAILETVISVPMGYGATLMVNAVKSKP